MQYDTNKFNSVLWKFYRKHKRNYLPWRKNTDPYFVLVSEFMLQQTQVKRVEEKFIQFTNIFPNIQTLSNAPLSDVLQHWSGLGYNRRAKFLRKSAKQIVEKYNGKVPANVLELDALPGIGVNTGGAIVVYAFNVPAVFVETNIRRVFIHHFFRDSVNVSDSDIMKLVDKTQDKKNPREWYWALMDYGSQLPKIVTNPNRKSKHYTKQTKFSGSLREVRGSILKTLTTSETYTAEELKMQTQGDIRAHYDTALDQLQKEGFLVIRDGKVTIR